MLTLEIYDQEIRILKDALELYLHTIKNEPCNVQKPRNDEEQHLDEDVIRDMIMRLS